VLIAIAVPAVSTKLSFNVRYVVMALPPFLLVLGALVLDLRPRRVMVPCLAILVAATSVSLVNWYTDDRYAKEQIDVAGKYLAANVAPGEQVYVSSWTASESLSFYGMRGSVIRVFPDTVEQLARELSGAQLASGTRVWLVETRTWESDPDGELRQVLDDRAVVADHQQWPGVEIRRYDQK